MTRKFVVLLTIAVGLFMATSASAQLSHIKNIVASPHNLSISGTGDHHGTDPATASQICIYCHKPHQSSKALYQPPLWNHTLSTTASYGVYSSPTFDAVGTDIAELGGATLGSATVSNLCLSCHDGTVAINSVYSGIRVTNPDGTSTSITLLDAGAGSGVAVIAGRAMDLKRLHPINFTYDAALAAKVTSLVTPAIGGGGPGGGMYVIPAVGTGDFLPLFPGPGGTGSKMQCATCHNVHDDTTNQPFLRDTRTGSQLCLDCHGN